MGCMKSTHKYNKKEKKDRRKSEEKEQLRPTCLNTHALHIFINQPLLINSIYTYVHTCIHTYIYMYIYTHTYIRTLSCTCSIKTPSLTSKLKS